MISYKKKRNTSRRQSAMWAVIRAHGGSWTARGIAEAADAPLSTAHQYVVALRRAGFVRLVKPRDGGKGHGAAPAWYAARRKAKPEAAPIVTWATRTARQQRPAP